MEIFKTRVELKPDRPLNAGVKGRYAPVQEYFCGRVRSLLTFGIIGGLQAESRAQAVQAVAAAFRQAATFQRVDANRRRPDR
jgi:hypothetical protein